MSELNNLLGIKHSENAMWQALRDFIDRKATLHVPVQETDPDIVLSSAIKELMELRKNSTKVSELREWCAYSTIKPRHRELSQWEEGFNQCLESILSEFCEVKE